MEDRVRSPEFGPNSVPPLAQGHCHAMTSGGGGFTLIELMVVIGVISLLMVLVVPAVSNLKGSGDLTNAAFTISGALEHARSHALGNNTYVWVGFCEEDAS